MVHNGRLFGIFNTFQCNWSDFQMLRCLYKKVSLSFTIISCVVATTRNFINKMQAEVFRNTVKFTFKVKKSKNFSFLDVKICRENNKFTPPFSGNLPLVV